MAGSGYGQAQQAQPGTGGMGQSPAQQMGQYQSPAQQQQTIQPQPYGGYAGNGMYNDGSQGPAPGQNVQQWMQQRNQQAQAMMPPSQQGGMMGSLGGPPPAPPGVSYSPEYQQQRQQLWNDTAGLMRYAGGSPGFYGGGQPQMGPTGMQASPAVMNALSNWGQMMQRRQHGGLSFPGLGTDIQTSQLAAGNAMPPGYDPDNPEQPLPAEQQNGAAAQNALQNQAMMERAQQHPAQARAPSIRNAPFMGAIGMMQDAIQQRQQQVNQGAQAQALQAQMQQRQAQIANANRVADFGQNFAQRFTQGMAGNPQPQQRLTPAQQERQKRRAKNYAAGIRATR